MQTIEAINSAVNDFVWEVPAMVCIIGVGSIILSAWNSGEAGAGVFCKRERVSESGVKISLNRIRIHDMMRQ